jgi:hypothetical protein
MTMVSLNQVRSADCCVNARQTVSMGALISMRI